MLPLPLCYIFANRTYIIIHYAAAEYVICIGTLLGGGGGTLRHQELAPLMFEILRYPCSYSMSARKLGGH